jgi:flavin reductase (DIM6/NTAB) family NADH-FMN oxidoreductase RutF
MHVSSQPAIFYLGTPVVLISTRNPDGSTNIAPMSSAWWLGWSCMLGLDASSRTVENLKREGECVLNLPSADMVNAVDRLAMLTGSPSVPMHKIMLGYKHSADKFLAAGLTQQASLHVAPSRIRECPIQLEAKVANIRPFAQADERMAISACAIEVQIIHAHIEENLLTGPQGNRVDPDQWNPLIMSFRRFYSIARSEHASKLAKGPESAYAPWQSRGLNKIVGMVYRNWAHRKYKDRIAETETAA